MGIVMIGIDLGKNSCSLAGLDERGSVVLRRRMQPGTVVGFASKLAPCTIAMEACCGAHHLGRLLAAQGHDQADGAGVCSSVREGAEER